MWESHLNQEIDFNGLKITVTQDLINNNPNLFQIVEEKKEELQQLLDEAQKRYPVGTKLSKDLTVTLHPDKKTYLVYPNKCVEVHIGNDKYAYVKTVDVDWRIEYKEPVKDLKYYEGLYIGSFYIQLRKLHPNLYYQLILQTIANDLNGDWTIDWNDDKTRKFCINTIGNKITIDSYSLIKHPNAFFKSDVLAQKAFDILGEDKLKIIFNVK